MGLLTGFATIVAVIAVGVALTHLGALDGQAQRTLAEWAGTRRRPSRGSVSLRESRTLTLSRKG